MTSDQVTACPATCTLGETRHQHIACEVGGKPSELVFILGESVSLVIHSAECERTKSSNKRPLHGDHQISYPEHACTCTPTEVPTT